MEMPTTESEICTYDEVEWNGEKQRSPFNFLFGLCMIKASVFKVYYL